MRRGHHLDTLGAREIALIPALATDSPDIVPSTDAPLDLDRLAQPLVAVVREAGAIGASYFRRGAERWTKSDESPVTEADIAVDRFLAAELPPLVEGAGWLSEETADTPERMSRRRCWIVDPIDGTRAFIEGQPEWVVSVALVENGAPIAGVVFNPCEDVLHFALKGQGATRNGETLAVTDSVALEGLLVGGPSALLNPLKPHGVIRAAWLYALANRLVQVADGHMDAALARPNAHDWDIAAAHLILEEAGARLTGLDGAVPSYNRPSTRHGALIAAAPGRADALLAALHAERDAIAALEPQK
ncbi:3'(2'),5'-bisphosphate nucleotidase CysQ [Hansschlegelia sp. KR7-227]|uniref:3'(2'),5'-bisphosphate nucleotidase CysQ n=1 Tax=Hansschlegelia sp. KR7-227 TaxID=3400914 RepID=UPI003C1206E8